MFGDNQGSPRPEEAFQLLEELTLEAGTLAAKAEGHDWVAVNVAGALVPADASRRAGQAPVAVRIIGVRPERLLLESDSPLAVGDLFEVVGTDDELRFESADAATGRCTACAVIEGSNLRFRAHFKPMVAIDVRQALSTT